MVKYFKIYVSSVVLFFIANTAAHALCDFEKVLIGSSLNSFQKKYVGELASASNYIQSYDIPISKICNDDFEQAVIKYVFINKNLQYISILDNQNDSEILKSLKYYYGDPTDGYDRSGAGGIRYYYWNKSDKSIYLIDKIFNDTREQIVEIVSDSYNNLSAKYLRLDDE